MLPVSEAELQLQLLQTPSSSLIRGLVLVPGTAMRRYLGGLKDPSVLAAGSVAHEEGGTQVREVLPLEGH